MTERELVFDKASHSADAIQRAVYRLSDQLSCEIESDDQNYRCRVHIASDDAEQIDATLNELRNEVVDQVLRERIRAQTELTRNLILSLAFSHTGLNESEAEE